MPRIMKDMGSVARDGEGANSEPIMPPKRTTTDAPAMPRARLRLKMGIFRDPIVFFVSLLSPKRRNILGTPWGFRFRGSDLHSDWTDKLRADHG